MLVCSEQHYAMLVCGLQENRDGVCVGVCVRWMWTCRRVVTMPRTCRVQGSSSIACMCNVCVHRESKPCARLTLSRLAVHARTQAHYDYKNDSTLSPRPGWRTTLDDPGCPLGWAVRRLATLSTRL